ncbi:MAG: hypothetical protein ABIU29_03450 [Chthoniobacterales bacterium]
MKTKSYPPVIHTEPVPSHPIGPKAFLLEPLLILGSSLLWVAVLPFAGLFCSVAALWKLTGARLDNDTGCRVGAGAYGR